MLSSNKTKFINSLKHAKFRAEHGLFVAEGSKIIQECIKEKSEVEILVSTAEWLAENQKRFSGTKTEMIETDMNGLKKISSFSTPPEAIAIIKTPVYNFEIKDLSTELFLGFEYIQDPGNLGTIIRTADWFGFKKIICSKDSVDIFNPKVIQATMGSFTRVKVYYEDLYEVVTKTDSTVWGTFLKGNNIYEEQLENTGLVIFGNEGKGISDKLEKVIKKRLFIPGFSDKVPESLNVSTATAVVCSEFRRRDY